MDRIIMHIDVNNAFLSWSALDLLMRGHPYDIRYTEAIIGGDEKSRHGIVLAKSMVAKSRGVKTAETIKEARRKCRNLEIYPPNFNFYKYMSHKMFELISKYTPDIEILSIDECFIDYGKIKKIYGDPIKFAYSLKKEIKKTLGFTVNIGIANNKLCAKMASDFLKPDRVHTLFDNEVIDKMYPLPIGDLYGIGKKTSEKLIKLNIKTIGDLANFDINILSKYFKNQAGKMINSAKGIDDSVIITKKRERISISKSITLPYNLNTIEEINKIIYKLVKSICESLKKQGKYASVVGVQLKDKNFITYSHQKKLLNVSNDVNDIYEISKKILKEMFKEEPIRLVGISINKIVSSNNYQISMFDNIEEKEIDYKLDEVINKINHTYGNNTISKGINNINNKIDK